MGMEKWTHFDASPVINWRVSTGCKVPSPTATAKLEMGKLMLEDLPGVRD